MFKLSNRSKLNRTGIDPRLIEIDDLAITITVVDYGHGKYAGLRAAAIQNYLYLTGKSKCDGYRIRGNHQAAADGYGKALDFYAYVEGKASWEHHHLAMVAAAFLQAASLLGYKLKWGGFWNTDRSEFINGIPYGWDMSHVEIID